MKRFINICLAFVISLGSAVVVGCGAQDTTKEERLKDFNPQVENTMRNNSRRRAIREEQEEMRRMQQGGGAAQQQQAPAQQQ